MKPLSKQLIFFSIAVLVFALGIAAVIAVNNRGNAPVAYWKLDEGYGSTTYDSAGSNDGTIYNALWRNEPDCKTGKCLWFDGDGDYVSLGNNKLGNLGDTHTFVAWVRLTASGQRAIISEYQDSVCGDGSFDVNNGPASFHDGGMNTINGVTNITDGKWHHAVFVSDTSNSYIYVDGILDNSTSDIDWQNLCSNTDVRIGGRIGTSQFFGFIDELKIYNYARTASQIKADYAAGAGGRGASVVQSSKFKVQSQSEGLLGHWKMDEASWTVDCSTDTVMDSSGNAKHGDACPNAGGLAPAAGKYGNAGSFDGTEDYVAVPDIDF